MLLQQPGSHRPDRRFHAGADLKFGKQAGEAFLDRLGANPQGGANLAVAAPGRQ